MFLHRPPLRRGSGTSLRRLAFDSNREVRRSRESRTDIIGWRGRGGRTTGGPPHSPVLRIVLTRSVASCLLPSVSEPRCCDRTSRARRTEPCDQGWRREFERFRASTSRSQDSERRFYRGKGERALHPAVLVPASARVDAYSRRLSFRAADRRGEAARRAFPEVLRRRFYLIIF
ncbi:hypothetical protein PUN28_007902 [Cardiocondyla obscurior]|uniref:Uncharacterized protein n=1 Tax=Cardiocondyla obscurior TaxID=286306 RepID=A0AAW2FWG7_9HYME